MYGYESEKEMKELVTDMSHQIYVNPEDRIRLKELLEMHNIVEGFESEHYTKDRKKIWVSMNVRAVRDVNGAIRYYETTTQDITERKRAELLLKESEVRYRSLFENAIEGIFITDPEGRYINVNPALAKMYGYQSPEEFLQEITDINNQSYVNHENGKIFREKIEREGFVENYESHMYRRDGSTFWVSTNAKVVCDENGRALYYEGTLVDITDRKKAEIALEKSKEELMVIIEGSAIPQFVIDRNHTVILWNKALERYSGIKSKDIVGTHDHWKAFYTKERPCLVDLAIESASEGEMTRFFGDNWNKSTLIDGAYVASGYFPNIKNGTWLLFTATAIRDASGNIIAGVETLEDITALKQTELSLSQAEEKYRSIFENATEGIYQTTKEGQFLMANPAFVRMPGYSSFEELKTSITNISTQLYVNPEDRVIINLAVNARDAMPGGGKLTIETSNVELDEEYVKTHKGMHRGSYVMISISDTGTGMSEEVMNHIFEPFFTTKEVGVGTGLGLSTVYGIVKQMNGNIWVYSEKGMGTTFKIYFPRVDGEKERLKKMTIREKDVSGNETILLVEDDKEVREMVRQMLEIMGYKVLVAENGEHAILLSANYKEPVHLIFTDVIMPGISGPKLIAKLKEFHPEAEVLYSSGYTDNVIVHHGVLDKGINFIQKPFTVENLSIKIKEVLEKKKR